MSRPIQEKSLSGATSTGAGTQLETGGRITVSLFVVTDSSPSTLDVTVEVSMDGTNWTEYQDASGNDELSVAASDFSSTGSNYAAFVTEHGLAARYVRANITGYSSGGNVDAWVAATSNPQTSKDYREV